MSDFVGIEVQGLEEMQRRLKQLPPAVADAGIDEANKYAQNVLRGYPPYRYVSLKQAYGGFVSAKQRRWFFAALGRGEIEVPYKRTQALSQSWKIEGKGRASFLYSDEAKAPYASYVMGDRQSRMHKLIGWKTAGAILQERKARVLEKFEAGVKKATRRLFGGG